MSGNGNGRKLTAKQQRFINSYLICWNGRRAAAEAGYQGNEGVLKQVGSENLTKPYIKAAIQERLTENAMSANEVLWRLGKIARGDLGDFPDVLSVSDLKDHPNSGIVKKVSTRTVGDSATISLELYSAHDALRDIGKHHQLFIDKIQVEDVTPTNEPIGFEDALTEQWEDDSDTESS